MTPQLIVPNRQLVRPQLILPSRFHRRPRHASIVVPTVLVPAEGQGALASLLTRGAVGGGGGFAEVGGGTQRAPHASFGSADFQTLAFPGNVVSGSLLIVGGCVYHGSGTGFDGTVTDTVSTPYTVLAGTTVSGLSSFIAYGLAAASGANTVTVTPAEAKLGYSFAIDEFSGSHATPLDVDGGTSTGTSTTPSDGITTITAGDLIIGVMCDLGEANDTITNNDGTTIGESEDGTATVRFNTMFQIVTTATAYTIDWTTTSQSWIAQTAAFKPA